MANQIWILGIESLEEIDLFYSNHNHEIELVGPNEKKTPFPNPHTSLAALAITACFLLDDNIETAVFKLIMEDLTLDTEDCRELALSEMKENTKESEHQKNKTTEQDKENVGAKVMSSTRRRAAKIEPGMDESKEGAIDNNKKKLIPKHRIESFSVFVNEDSDETEKGKKEVALIAEMQGELMSILAQPLESETIPSLSIEETILKSDTSPPLSIEEAIIKSNTNSRVFIEEEIGEDEQEEGLEKDMKEASEMDPRAGDVITLSIELNPESTSTGGDLVTVSIKTVDPDGIAPDAGDANDHADEDDCNQLQQACQPTVIDNDDDWGDDKWDHDGYAMLMRIEKTEEIDPRPGKSKNKGKDRNKKITHAKRSSRNGNRRTLNNSAGVTSHNTTAPSSSSSSSLSCSSSPKKKRRHKKQRGVHPYKVKASYFFNALAIHFLRYSIFSLFACV